MTKEITDLGNIPAIDLEDFDEAEREFWNSDISFAELAARLDIPPQVKFTTLRVEPLVGIEVWKDKAQSFRNVLKLSAYYEHREDATRTRVTWHFAEGRTKPRDWGWDVPEESRKGFTHQTYGGGIKPVVSARTDADLYAALCKLLGLSEFGPVEDGSKGLGRAMMRLGEHLAQADKFLVRTPKVGQKVEWVEKGGSLTSPMMTGYVIGPVVSSAGAVKENCWVVNRSPEGMKLGDESIVFVARDRLRSAGATEAAARTAAEANR